MEQIERIQYMELLLNRAAAAIMQLSAALDQLEHAQEDIKLLSDYYGSTEWKRDFADDEAGLLPHHLPRSVLSEDAIWNLLEDYRELRQRMKAM